MKPLGLIGLGIGTFAVVFAGVLTALQVDRQHVAATSRPIEFLTRQAPTMTSASLTSAAFDFRASAKRALQSAVSIQTVVRQTDFFGEDQGLRPYAQGSGVIIDTKGYIVTNNHVVRVGDVNGQIAEKVVVTLYDGKSYDAKVVGADSKADIAIIKLDGVDVTPIELGDSSKLEPGQWVMAVGNPLGLENSVTLGIVSSLGRQLAGDGTRLFIDGIQTDAAINMGNSGGPLVDDQARLVGINSSIAKTDQYSNGNIGIGFAIPVNRMKQVVDDIIKFGRAKYGSMGLDFRAGPGFLLARPEVREAYKERFGATPPEQGLFVYRVTQGGPADKAGVKLGDILTEVAGKPVKDPASFLALISTGRPGDKVSIKVFSGGTLRDVTVTLGEAQ